MSTAWDWGLSSWTEPENREKEPLSSKQQVEAGQRQRDPSSPVQA